MLVFDDLSWPGVRRAWDRILVHPRLSVAVDLRHMGLCVMHRGTGGHAGGG